MRSRLGLIITGLAAAAVLAGCSGSGGGGSPSGTASGGPASTGAASTGPASTGTSAAAPSSSVPSTFPSASAPSGPVYYVSLGDSYAAGYQGTGRGTGATTTHGFAYQVVTKARAKGYDYRLVNFGCAGATTRSMLSTPGCPARLLGPGAPRYSATQTAAAVAFLKQHRGHIGLVTVSIGGNDVIPCGAKSDALGCLTSAVGSVRTNLDSILRQVRSAAGPAARIVGTTYPDVLLGNLLSTDSTLRSLAPLSVTAFRSLINPQLQQAYTGVGGRFVDVTAAFGGYGSLSEKTSLPGRGSVPVPVARICTLTYFCDFQDIHPRTPGYAIIADLVTATLPHE
ncbi:SGNH/GDSL hydrolase family protein [uncultured Jatrophihabitans sp.]|uniref:SGNH/GDSL hydrolase family protein n=1 Tax=uncultured Jatrophihabitans sp. TaxID=1610747 RepID=UPI0035CBEDCF